MLQNNRKQNFKETFEERLGEEENFEKPACCWSDESPHHLQNHGLPTAFHGLEKDSGGKENKNHSVERRKGNFQGQDLNTPLPGQPLGSCSSLALGPRKLPRLNTQEARWLLMSVATCLLPPSQHASLKGTKLQAKVPEVFTAYKGEGRGERRVAAEGTSS